MINKLDNTLNFHHKALNVRAARQELLAGNIAN
ncbi:MAG: flagellar basal body rod protein FlgB, partial [Nitrosomonas halophila]